MTDEFVVPAVDVEALAERFGSSIRGIGRSNADGTLTMSRTWWRKLSGVSRSRRRSKAAVELETLTQILDTPSAKTIVERLVAAKEHQLHEMIADYQNTNDTRRMEDLQRAIIREIFPE
jgi:hypothetical protein